MPQVPRQLGGLSGDTYAPLGPGSVAAAQDRERLAGHIPSSRLPWYVEKPNFATDFVLTSVNTGVSAGPGPVSNVVVAGPFQIGQTSIGVIKSVAFYVNNLLATSQITFSLWSSGAPVIGYGRYQMFPTTLPFKGVVFDHLSIMLDMNAQVQVVVSVTDAVTYIVGADVTGWYLSRELAARFAAGEVMD